MIPVAVITETHYIYLIHCSISNIRLDVNGSEVSQTVVHFLIILHNFQLKHSNSKEIILTVTNF